MSELENEVRALREELDQLKSREEIRQGITRYGRGQEWLDETLMKEVFWPDAWVDFGFFEGTFEEYLPKLMEIERGPNTTFHLSAAPQIELDGDTAYVEVYGIAGSRGDEQTNVYGGRYIDRWERRNGQWRIAQRLYTLDWNISQDVPDVIGGEHPELKMIDPRSPEHPWFRRMGANVTG